MGRGGVGDRNGAKGADCCVCKGVRCFLCLQCRFPNYSHKKNQWNCLVYRCGQSNRADVSKYVVCVFGLISGVQGEGCLYICWHFRAFSAPANSSVYPPSCCCAAFADTFAYIHIYIYRRPNGVARAVLLLVVLNLNPSEILIEGTACAKGTEAAIKDLAPENTTTHLSLSNSC